jgi:uncharacterized protein YegJ (DUF2314 family)
MRRFRRDLWFGLMLLLSIACAQPDRTISVAQDDPEMVAAIGTARQKLPLFWEIYEKRPDRESDFCLKVRITDQRGAEHFWAVNIERRDGRIMGTINNDPTIVATVKLGDRIEIPDADVTDWLYKRGDKLVGNYTIRPLFRSMSPDDVARAKSIMEWP